jgi:excisionase family DNA binding protein
MISDESSDSVAGSSADSAPAHLAAPPDQPHREDGQDMLTGDEYETPRSAAKRIGCGERFVREVLCASNGDLTYYKIGSKYKILKRSVDDYIDRISRGGNPP